MTDHAMHHVPTLAERAWRRLGYRYHLGVDPIGTDGMPGWFRTDIRFHFGVLDRLRLLLTGRLFVAVISHADANVSVVKSRTDWIIRRPGERDRGDIALQKRMRAALKEAEGRDE